LAWLGFDPISPLKPRLGSDFAALTQRLQHAIATRYRLPEGCHEDYLLHNEPITWLPHPKLCTSLVGRENPCTRCSAFD